MNEARIAAKERWAAKMAGRTPSRPPSTERLPPGQHRVSDFPVLDLGVQPAVTLEDWRLQIHGKVKQPIVLDWNAFMALPQFSDVSDLHCVTTWSQFDMEFRGVSFFTLLDLVHPLPEATHVYFKAHDGYTTNNPLEALMDDDVMIAHSWNGAPLTREHGGPARVLIPKRYAWKGAKWVKEIIFLDRDLLGFWELRGYSNSANPFKEERFA